MTIANIVEGNWRNKAIWRRTSPEDLERRQMSTLNIADKMFEKKRPGVQVKEDGEGAACKGLAGLRGPLWQRMIKKFMWKRSDINQSLYLIFRNQKSEITQGVIDIVTY